MYSEIWDWRIVGLMQQVSQIDKSDWYLIGYDLFINDQSAQNSNMYMSYHMEHKIYIGIYTWGCLYQYRFEMNFLWRK